jgi:hypothetical protein
MQKAEQMVSIRRSYFKSDSSIYSLPFIICQNILSQGFEPRTQAAISFFDSKFGKRFLRWGSNPGCKIQSLE